MVREEHFTKSLCCFSTGFWVVNRVCPKPRQDFSRGPRHVNGCKREQPEKDKRPNSRRIRGFRNKLIETINQMDELGLFSRPQSHGISRARADAKEMPARGVVSIAGYRKV